MKYILIPLLGFLVVLSSKSYDNSHEEISKYSSNVIISNEANTDESLINHLTDANIGADNYKSNIILGSYNLGKKAKDKDD